MDKHNDNEIRLGSMEGVKLLREVISVSGNNPELLNAVYKEISEKLGMDTAISMDLARKVAKEKNLSYNGVFTQKMTDSIRYHTVRKNMPYNKLKEIMKCEGIVNPL